MKLFAMVTRLTFCAIVGANVEAEYAWFCRQYFLWRYPPVFGVNLCNRWTSPRIEEAAGASTWSSRFMISLVMRLTAHVQRTWEMCLIATKNSLLMILYINKTSRCESWKTTVKTRHIETDSSVCFHAGGWFLRTISLCWLLWQHLMWTHTMGSLKFMSQLVLCC